MEAIPAALVEVLRQIVNLIADEEWQTLANVFPTSRVTWEDVARVKAQYGGVFVHSPGDLAASVVAVPAPDGTWSISCPLWTVDEGRSDLEFRATATEVYGGLWRVDVDDLLVP